MSQGVAFRSGSWYRQKLHIAPLPGYPWSGKFSQFEELNAYFNADKLTCLLCGRQFNKLGNHISQGHQIPMDEYKERFGIPWTRGLAGKTYREKSSEHIKALRLSGKMAAMPSVEVIEKLKGTIGKRRPFTEAYRNDSRRRLLELNGRTKLWGSADYEEFLLRIESGRTPAEVGRDIDMPGAKAFRKYVRANPDFKRRYEVIWENLPYSVQVRASKLGEKFEQEVVRLRRQRIKLSDIASILGVEASSVRSTFHKLKKKGKLEPVKLTHK